MSTTGSHCEPPANDMIGPPKFTVSKMALSGKAIVFLVTFNRSVFPVVTTMGKSKGKKIARTTKNETAHKEWDYREALVTDMKAFALGLALRNYFNVLLSPVKDAGEELTAFSTSSWEILADCSNHEPLSHSTRFFLFFLFKKSFFFFLGPGLAFVFIQGLFSFLEQFMMMKRLCYFWEAQFFVSVNKKC